MPSGIADLVLWLTLSLTVVEIKKGELDIKAIAQLERYIADLRHLHEDLYHDIPFESDLHAHSISIYNTSIAGGRAPIHGILIGNSIDKQTQIHCQLNRFEVILYDYENGEYTFERDPFVSLTTGLFDYDSDVVDAMKQLMRQLKLYTEDMPTLVAIYKGLEK